MAKAVKLSAKKGLEEKIIDLVVKHVHKSLTQAAKNKAEEKKKIAAGAPVYQKIRAFKRVEADAPKAVKKPEVKTVKEKPKSEVVVEKPPVTEKPVEVASTPTAKAEPIAKPYEKIDSVREPKRTKETGEYIHHKYKFGTPLYHTSSKYTGPVHYVATFSSEGNPLVQPVDHEGIPTEKPFQAEPKNLTEK